MPGNLPSVRPGLEDTYQSYGYGWTNASKKTVPAVPTARPQGWHHGGANRVMACRDPGSRSPERAARARYRPDADVPRRSRSRVALRVPRPADPSRRRREPPACPGRAETGSSRRPALAMEPRPRGARGALEAGRIPGPALGTLRLRRRRNRTDRLGHCHAGTRHLRGAALEGLEGRTLTVGGGRTARSPPRKR